MRGEHDAIAFRAHVDPVLAAALRERRSSVVAAGGKSEPEPVDIRNRLPPPNAGLDYQLGGAYPPPAGVTVVSRDRTEAPAPGLYNICYVNGFQVQPDEEAWWRTNHPDLILRDGNGEAVIDRDWDEMLLDVRRRPRGARARGDRRRRGSPSCAADGFDAVEIDNLDTYTRLRRAPRQRTTRSRRCASMPTRRTPAAWPSRRRTRRSSSVGAAEMGTDFAVAEECNRYSECDVYTDAYGDQVLVIEYRRRDFDAGCAAFPDLSIVLRDLDLVTPADKGYVRDAC